MNGPFSDVREHGGVGRVGVFCDVRGQVRTQLVRRRKKIEANGHQFPTSSQAVLLVIVCGLLAKLDKELIPEAGRGVGHADDVEGHGVQRHARLGLAVAHVYLH